MCRHVPGGIKHLDIGGVHPALATLQSSCWSWRDGDEPAAWIPLLSFPTDLCFSHSGVTSALMPALGKPSPLQPVTDRLALLVCCKGRRARETAVAGWRRSIENL